MPVPTTLLLALSVAPIVATGDLRPDSVVLWADHPTAAAVEGVLEAPDTGSISLRLQKEAGVFQRRLDGLKPATLYTARVCAEEACASVRFRTPPVADAAAPVRFVFSGDLAGQNVCRDRERGFPVFEVMADARPDFFVALGDMVYADLECRKTGLFGNEQIAGPPVSATFEEFAAHWRYTRADPAYQRFLAGTPLFAVWDDHEVINDFSPVTAVRDGEALLPPARAAMLAHNPIDRGEAGSGRMYGAFRWGRHVELFLLDTRSYRDDKAVPDGPQKSMLGAAQRDWLIEALLASDATWKIVASSVPLSLETGWPPEDGRDSWANAGDPTGYESELFAIAQRLADQDVRNLVWIAADVHFATAFRHTPFTDRPDFTMYEAVVGPLSAGLYPNTEFDPSLNPERLFFHGPERSDPEVDFDTALQWMNFAQIDVDAAGELVLSYANARAESLVRLSISPRPARR